MKELEVAKLQKKKVREIEDEIGGTKFSKIVSTEALCPLVAERKRKNGGRLRENGGRLP